MSGINTSSKLGFFIAGLSVGAVVGLLFAPKSGQETRAYIAGKAGEGRDYMVATGKELRRHAEGFVDRGKSYVAKQKERLADALRAS